MAEIGFLRRKIAETFESTPWTSRGFFLCAPDVARVQRTPQQAFFLPPSECRRPDATRPHVGQADGGLALVAPAPDHFERDAAEAQRIGEFGGLLPGLFTRCIYPPLFKTLGPLFGTLSHLDAVWIAGLFLKVMVGCLAYYYVARLQPLSLSVVTVRCACVFHRSALLPSPD